MATYYNLDLTAANVNAALNDAHALRTAKASASEGQMVVKQGNGYGFADPSQVTSVNSQTGDVEIESDCFIAEYGVTTAADIYAAWQAGKNIFLNHRFVTPAFNLTWRLSSASASACYFFAIASNNTEKSYCISVSGSTWSSVTTMESQSVSGRVASWSETPSDMKYPSEKLVKDSLDAKVSEPSTDGTSGQVLATDGAGVRYWKTVSGGGGGSSDYNDLDNKPSIGGVTLQGNKTLDDIGAISNPSTKTSGQVLTYDGSAWVAQNQKVLSVNGKTGAVIINKAFAVNLPVSGWVQSSGKYTQTASVSGITASSVLSVSPAPADSAIWSAAKILAVAQAANSITFECETIPTDQVTANVLMTEVAL